MFVYCNKCNWYQDDFYDDSYNPPQYLKDWNKYLFGESKHQLDKPFTEDYQFIQENGNITTREVLAGEYEKFANNIRNMKWITYEEYDKSDKKCPRCNSILSID